MEKKKIYRWTQIELDLEILKDGLIIFYTKKKDNKMKIKKIIYIYNNIVTKKHIHKYIYIYIFIYLLYVYIFLHFLIFLSKNYNISKKLIA